MPYFWVSRIKLAFEENILKLYSWYIAFYSMVIESLKIMPWTGFEPVALLFFFNFFYCTHSHATTQNYFLDHGLCTHARPSLASLWRCRGSEAIRHNRGACALALLCQQSHTSYPPGMRVPLISHGTRPAMFMRKSFFCFFCRLVRTWDLRHIVTPFVFS